MAARLGMMHEIPLGKAEQADDGLHDRAERDY